MCRGLPRNLFFLTGLGDGFAVSVSLVSWDYFFFNFISKYIYFFFSKLTYSRILSVSMYVVASVKEHPSIVTFR